MPAAIRRKSSCAFTLVELLFVLGIVATLMGVLVPVLGRARVQAKATTELAATRQLLFAYLNYANENRGTLLPGHVTYDPKLVDDLGDPLTPSEAGKRWPWRLVRSLQNKLWGTILVGSQAEALKDRSIPLWNYTVSLYPSFGLNYFNLGGDQTAAPSSQPGCITKLTKGRFDTRLIVFCSSRAVGSNGMAEGYFKVVPPTKSFEYSSSGWALARYDPQGDPAAWGYVHPRYFGRAVVGLLDGHSELLPFEDLRDMTRWSEAAAEAGNPNWPGNP